MFHKNELGREIELQNTHIVLFKSPKDVLQVGGLIFQLGLGFWLTDWYKDATFIPFGELLIDLLLEQMFDYDTVKTTQKLPPSFTYRNK